MLGEPTSVSLKRVASALLTAEEELEESAPDFAPAPMIVMDDDDDESGAGEDDDDEEGRSLLSLGYEVMIPPPRSGSGEEGDGDRSRDPGHSPPVVSEGTWVAL